VRTCKIGLKIQGARAYNFAASGSNVTKLFDACREARGRGVQVGTKFGEGPPPKIWEGKIRRDFRQLSTLIANISRMARPVENGKVIDQLPPLPRWAKKYGERWSTNKKVISTHVNQPKLHFSGDYISALRGVLAPQFFTRTRD